MSGAETREVAVRQSLIRSKLLMGGERQATVWNFGIAFLIVIITKDLTGLLAAVAIAAVVQGLLVLLAKWDHQAIEVVTRARKYKEFYGNGASLDAEPGIVHVPGRAPVAGVIGLLRGRKGAKDAQS